MGPAGGDSQPAESGAGLRILDAEQMRQVDRAAIEELGVPSVVLMENAALGVVDAIGECYPEVRSVALFCGAGNNGGDGLAVARHLAVRGYTAHIFLFRRPGRELTGDAAIQLEICRRMQLPLWEVSIEDSDLTSLIEAARGSDLLVDALFGTGLSRPLEGFWADLVKSINRLTVPLLAVDLPSGLIAGCEEIPGPCLWAGRTVTFATPKVAQIFPPARDAVGELVIADLGVPAELAESVGGARMSLLSEAEIAALLPPPRRPRSHKGSHGHVLVVAGGPGGGGAAVLTAAAAGRCGAGLVTVATAESVATGVDAAALEAMVVALPEGERGLLSAAARPLVAQLSVGKSVLALGPGLGGGEEIAALLRALVADSTLPLVLDADGLNAFAGRLGELAARTTLAAPTILTPHPGEMARLLGITSEEVQRDRPAAARQAAAESGAIVVLKGHLTLIAVPSGELWVNPTGNPGLATGGTGDLLTGMIAALAAQAVEARAAACAGVFLHGLAGDLSAERQGEVAVLASDVLTDLSRAWRQVQRH